MRRSNNETNIETSNSSIVAQTHFSFSSKKTFRVGRVLFVAMIRRKRHGERESEKRSWANAYKSPLTDSSSEMEKERRSEREREKEGLSALASWAESERKKKTRQMRVSNEELETTRRSNANNS